MVINGDLPSVKRLHNYGTSAYFSWVYQLEMAIFNSYVKLPEGTDDLRVNYGEKMMSFQFDS
jgi:hypothetical protein